MVSAYIAMSISLFNTHTHTHTHTHSSLCISLCHTHTLDFGFRWQETFAYTNPSLPKSDWSIWQNISHVLYWTRGTLVRHDVIIDVQYIWNSLHYLYILYIYIFGTDHIVYIYYIFGTDQIVYIYYIFIYLEQITLFIHIIYLYIWDRSHCLYILYIYMFGTDDS